MALSYFFHRPPNQPASRFAGIGVRDAAQQPPPKKTYFCTEAAKSAFSGEERGLCRSGARFLSLTGHRCCLDTP